MAKISPAHPTRPQFASPGVSSPAQQFPLRHERYILFYTVCYESVARTNTVFQNIVKLLLPLKCIRIVPCV